MSVFNERWNNKFYYKVASYRLLLLSHLILSLYNVERKSVRLKMMNREPVQSTLQGQSFSCRSALFVLFPTPSFTICDVQPRWLISIAGKIRVGRWRNMGYIPGRSRDFPPQRSYITLCIINHILVTVPTSFGVY